LCPEIVGAAPGSDRRGCSMFAPYQKSARATGVVGFRLTLSGEAEERPARKYFAAPIAIGGLSSFKVLLGVVGGADVQEARLDVERVAIKRVAGNGNIVGYDAG
jgi:hypothetical protein